MMIILPEVAEVLGTRATIVGIHELTIFEVSSEDDQVVDPRDEGHMRIAIWKKSPSTTTIDPSENSEELAGLVDASENIFGCLM